MYEVSPLVHGVPATTSSHGSFGWSSVWMARGARRVVIIDPGPIAYASILRSELAAARLSFADVTDVLITHAHWDHVMNYSLFPAARLWVRDEELRWALSSAQSYEYISKPIATALSQEARLERISSEGLIFDGVEALFSPGHTPGHCSFAVEGHDATYVFAGDSIKNQYEANGGDFAMTMDLSSSEESRNIQINRSRDDGATYLVPGHDVPLCFTDGRFTRSQHQYVRTALFESEQTGWKANQVLLS